MKKVTCYIFLFATLLGMRAQAQSQYNAELKQAFVLITQMRFDEAKVLVAQEEKRQPSNQVTAYLRAAMVCCELFVNEDAGIFDAAQPSLDELMDEIEEMEEENPFRNLFLAEVYIARATLNGKFKNNIKAAWQFYRAYDLLSQNAIEHPQFLPNNIPLGVLHVAIGSLPDDYQTLASLLGFSGSIENGLQMLHQAYYQLSATPSLNFYANYAGFVYSFVSFQLGVENNSTPENLGLKVGDSPFLIYTQARIEWSNGNAKRAIHFLNKRPQKENYTPFYHLDYLQGKMMIGLDPEAATLYFIKYLKNSPSQMYIKSSYRYLSWCYLLLGNETKAAQMRQNVFRYGEAQSGADKQALNESKRELNVTLIKARVLFDTGLLVKAKNVLLQIAVEECCATPYFKAEYYYRLGRIHQEMGNTEEALQWFKKALAVPEVASCYALGNSALQAGTLLVSTDAKQAYEYLKMALTYKSYPFYEGIHQKAKTALAQLD